MAMNERRVWLLGAATLAVASIAGCVEAPVIPGARPDLLGFLKDGQTRREEAILALGQPSGAFEKEAILTYRIGHDAKQGYYIVDPRAMQSWGNARYSLVLIFDEKGVLRTQKLIPVQ